MTTAIVFIFLIILFISIWYIMKPSSKKKWPEPSESVKYVKPKENTVTEYIKPTKKYVRFRSMTKIEKRYYNRKPNLQWWVDLYGKSVFNDFVILNLTYTEMKVIC